MRWTIVAAGWLAIVEGILALTGYVSEPYGWRGALSSVLIGTAAIAAVGVFLLLAYVTSRLLDPAGDRDE